MEVIIGIDLGTTNSEVAVIEAGRPRVLEENGDPIVPSVVGLDPNGKLLVGRAARNQFVLAPERTIRSIKRQMGQDVTVALGDQKYTPQEVSAIILRALKQRAERALGQQVSKAVITVPAFFTEAQRDATREAGTLAGLDVVRIINEPTAAVLTYDPNPPEMERLLVYDLGGGTFDVSIAQVEAGVVEILASHGDTQLGGDDFDQLLLDHVADQFQTAHGVDLRKDARSRSRLLSAVEEAKKRLSLEPFVRIEEEFIAEKDGVPLNLSQEVSRFEYESLIMPLIDRTLSCVDKSLSDAQLVASQIDKVVLVGGATRTPLVQSQLTARLKRPVHVEIEPDLAVAMGAAVQGALIAGVDVGAVLVDITPHSLGIDALGEDEFGNPIEHLFSPIIHRNTPLPASRTEVYSTAQDSQKAARIYVYQGEAKDARRNHLVGEFLIDGLAPVPAPNDILVRLELNLNGILKVTATERSTGLAKQVVIENMMERFRKRQRAGAVERLSALFDSAWDEPMRGREVTLDVDVDDEAAAEPPRGDVSYDEFPTGVYPTIQSVTPAASQSLSDAHVDPEWSELTSRAESLVAKAQSLLTQAAVEDANELRGMLADLSAASESRDSMRMRTVMDEVEDLVFYLEG